MIFPALLSRIEERRYVVGLRVNRAQITSLANVAQDTCQSEIRQSCWATVLVSNHMIRLVAGDGIILVNEAILASVASPSNDLSAQIGRRPGSHEFFF
jgi:hypothetical protein